jgi:asparagine synthase (glutamine-hydrolysing)
MCGIAGFWGQGSLNLAGRMIGRLTHRGPDGSGLWADEEAAVFLGHRRLSVVDLATGAQPMSSACGRYVITFNGEIYNHADLRSQLEARGRIFLTDHSDTEVLLNGYAEWGPQLLERCNGMWAFAIFDRQQRTLFLARDRFGEKPLYYAPRPEAFVFASELTALTAHPAVSSSVCPTGLRKFFAYGYLPSPWTGLAEARKLPAAHWMLVDCRTGSIQIQRYWRYIACPKREYDLADPRDLATELRERLKRSVQLRYRSDVPVGLFLSGGVDSSTLAALAVEAGQNVRTFSIGFEEKSFDESAQAERVARHLGTEHHRRLLRAAEVPAFANRVLDGLDEPLGDASLVPTSLLCEFARQEVTVALGGDGSDEMLFGYDPFKALRMASLYRSLMPGPVHQGILQLAARMPVSHRNMSLDFKVKRGLRGAGYPPPLWGPVWMSSLAEPDLRAFAGSDATLEETFSEAIEAWDACEAGSLEDRLCPFYIELYLQNDILAKVDRASMRVGLEVRAPFLDTEVVDLVRQIPARLKFADGTGKVILRQAMASALPAEILDRPKKGFGMPVGKWFRDRVLEPGEARWGNPQTARDFHNRHLQDQADERGFLWSLLVVNRWMDALNGPVEVTA